MITAGTSQNWGKKAPFEPSLGSTAKEELFLN
jgi:hypothetical protein